MNSKVIKLYNKINNDEKDIIIFGLSDCIYCNNSIKLIKKNNISYKYYLIDKHFNLFFKLFLEVAKLYPYLLINIEHKTVPVIFYKKKFVGGYNELNKKLSYV